jgi:DNA-directed RNA polymerase specialized sigma24 family protein
MQTIRIDQHTILKEDGADGLYLLISFKTIRGEHCFVTPDDAAFKPLLESLLNFKRTGDAISRNNEHLQLTEEEMALKGGKTVLSAESCAMNSLLGEELKWAFLQLPATQAKRFLLHHAFGYSHKEIASLEGCSVDASKKSVRLAKKKLQIILANRVHVLPFPTTSK